MKKLIETMTKMIPRLMRATDTSVKRTAARLSIMVAMVLLWVEVSQWVLGGGPSPIIVGVVLGYGLTDHFIAAASGGRYKG